AFSMDLAVRAGGVHQRQRLAPERGDLHLRGWRADHRLVRGPLRAPPPPGGERQGTPPAGALPPRRPVRGERAALFRVHRFRGTGAGRAAGLSSMLSL
ncbi:MAG: hypothetical protein AVDCRST_MAG68-4027, partial [uncultured Gemmatimonadetes bacterium]